MAKEQILKNPFKSGPFILLLGFMVNALAMFMVFSQMLPGSVSAQSSGPAHYIEYWCAGEVYAGVNPSGAWGGVSDGDRAIWQRFIRGCRWKAAAALRPYGAGYSEFSHIPDPSSGVPKDYSLAPTLDFIFGDFRTKTIVGPSGLVTILNTALNNPDAPWAPFLNAIAPKPFTSSQAAQEETWKIIQRHSDSRGLNFSDQASGGAESNTGFVTEWFVYGEIGGDSLFGPGGSYYSSIFGGRDDLYSNVPSP